MQADHVELTIDPAAPEPLFEQLRRQVAERAADGRLPAGHQLPTVRALAERLGLATNTVAKAYRALESDGVTETRGRHGTRITTQNLDDADAGRAVAAYVRVARRQGLTRDEAVRLVDEHWS